MGAGYHGGFGQTIGCSVQRFVLYHKVELSKITLPPNNPQLGHIFGNRLGHLPDTPENRKKLENLANDDTKFVGCDKYGNQWNAQIEADGSQTWVRYRNGLINEGGNNKTPRKWDTSSGFNNNPFNKSDNKKKIGNKRKNRNQGGNNL